MWVTVNKLNLVPEWIIPIDVVTLNLVPEWIIPIDVVTVMSCVNSLLNTTGI